MAQAARQAAEVVPLWRIQAGRKVHPEVKKRLDRAHELQFTQARTFYQWVENDLAEPDKRYLDLIDRYYLLRFTLGREDLWEHGAKGNRWLYERVREVEAEPDGCLDLWSRYHYKSSIITFAGVIQEVLRDPEITIAIFSFNNKIAKGFLWNIKTELEQNECLRLRYPDIFFWEPHKQSPSWGLDTGLLVKRRRNPKEKTVEAYGLVDGQPTSRHFKLRVYDDVWTRDNVTTPEQIKKTQIARELSENLGVPHGAREQNIGTRYSYADGYGTMLDRGTIKPRIYPATDTGKLDGTPVFLTEEKWAEIKRKQPSTVAAQMLQNPLEGQGRMFEAEWFRAWWVRPRTLNVYIMCDPSKGSPNRRSDRTAIAVVGVDANRNKYLLDGFCHRMKPDERWINLRNLYKRWTSVPGVMCVSVGYEQYGMLNDIAYFEERMQVEARQGAPTFVIEELNWTRDHTESKADRVERLVPDVKNGDFFLPALVWANNQICEWKPNAGRVVFSEMKSEPKTWAALRAMQEKHRIPQAITRYDEDKQIYDVTARLMEELMFVPFSTHDDLCDALSRIYDMKPVAPEIYHDADIEPRVYADT